MESLKITETSWRDLPAWKVESSVLKLVVCQYGAHLACIQDFESDVNPLWQPVWESQNLSESAQPSIEVYGEPPESYLLTKICGHSLCFDRFGARPDENRPMHGEAGCVLWKQTSEKDSCFCIKADLPQAAFQLKRKFFFEGRSIKVETEAYFSGSEPRSVEWCEHVVLGDPFLDQAKIEAKAAGFYYHPTVDMPHARWKNKALTLEDCLAMPKAEDPTPYGDVVSLRIEKGWWKASSPKHQRSLEFHWPREDFPWLCLWTEHKSRTFKPWDGKTRTRGMEFSTKPFPEGAPSASRFPTFEGVSTDCLLQPNQIHKKTFHIHWNKLT